MALGMVLQCVGLIRGRVVPVWVPTGLLFAVLTLVVPGGGALRLVTSVPMALGAIGPAYFTWRSGVGPDGRLRADLGAGAAHRRSSLRGQLHPAGDRQNKER